MLYYLFRYLGEYGVSGANLWHYVSFRAVLTLVLSLLISMWFGQYFIKWMKNHNGSEAQRDASIDPYGVEKKGVPMEQIARLAGHSRISTTDGYVQADMATLANAVAVLNN